jgi:hypothetical protein
MREMKSFAKAVPVLLLIGDGIAFLFSYTSIFIDFMWFHSEVSGHSLLTVGYIAYFSYRFKVCLYTWASVTALATLNLLNILYFFVPLEYYTIYAGIIIFSGLTMTLFYALSTNRSTTARRKL